MKKFKNLVLLSLSAFAGFGSCVLAEGNVSASENVAEQYFVAADAELAVSGQTVGSLSSGDIISAVDGHNGWLWVPAEKAYVHVSDSIIPVDVAFDALNALISDGRSNGVSTKAQFANLLKARSAIWETKGDFVNSVSDLTEAIAINPFDATLFEQRALVYSNCLDEQEKAIADLTEAIRLSQRDSVASLYYLRSTAGIAMGTEDSLRAAISDANEIVRHRPNLALSYQLRADAYFANNDLDLARRDYEKSRDMDPTVAKVYEKLAEISFNTNDFDSVVKFASQALALDAGSALARRYRAMANHLSGNTTEAVKDLTAILQAEPTFGAGRELLISIFEKRENWDAVFRQSAEWLSIDPGNSRAKEKMELATNHLHLGPEALVVPEVSDSDGHNVESSAPAAAT